jgi:hypothetical protein
VVKKQKCGEETKDCDAKGMHTHTHTHTYIYTHTYTHTHSHTHTHTYTHTHTHTHAHICTHTHTHTHAHTHTHTHTHLEVAIGDINDEDAAVRCFGDSIGVMEASGLMFLRSYVCGLICQHSFMKVCELQNATTF